MGKSAKIIQINDQFNEKDTLKYIKSYMFIKGYAVAKNLNQTLIALSVARRLHEGQYRKDGKPYILHPLKVCSTLISYGIDEDIILAGALLHDVLEDCEDKLSMGAQELVLKYNISQEVVDIVTLLTKESGLDDYELGIYFKNIEANPRAALIKLSDRLHNSSTLYAFSLVKLKKYLRETSMYLLPMASFCKNYYPEYTNAFSILKSNIYSLNNSMTIMVQKYDEALLAGQENKGGKII